MIVYCTIKLILSVCESLVRTQDVVDDVPECALIYDEICSQEDSEDCKSLPRKVCTLGQNENTKTKDRSQVEFFIYIIYTYVETIFIPFLLV